MATRLLQFEVPKTDDLIQVEMEESVPFKMLISKLKMYNYLDATGTYFIKTLKGESVRENDAVRLSLDRNFIVTDDPAWKPKADPFNAVEIHELSDGIVLNEGSYWFLPFAGNLSWGDGEVTSRFFELDDIITFNNMHLVVRMAVQYSAIDVEIPESVNGVGMNGKMKQIFTDTLNQEIIMNRVSDEQMFVNAGLLAGKIQVHVASHMELVWGTKVHCVEIAGYKYSGTNW